MLPGFPKRLTRLRKQQGLTLEQVAREAKVALPTLSRYNSGRTTPSLAKGLELAQALGLPIAQLFTDDLVLAEVRVSPDTLERVRREGRQAARDAADRIAGGLEPLIWQEATRPPVDMRPGARAKPRRTREEVLAKGIAELRALDARKRKTRRNPSIQADFSS